MLKITMATGQTATNAKAVSALLARLERGPLAMLAVLTLVASLTEGIGLFLLIPLAHIFAGDGPEILPGAFEVLPEISPTMLLLLVALLVSGRAVMVYVANELRRGIALDLSHGLRSEAHGAILQAEWRYLANQNSADQTTVILSEAERSSSLFDDAVTIATVAVTLCVLVLAGLLFFPAMTLLLLAIGAPLALLAAMLKAGTAQGGEAYWGAYSGMQDSLADGIARLRAARIAGAQDALAADFARASSSLAELERSYFRLGHRQQTIFQIASVVALVSAVYLALGVFETPLALLLPPLFLAIRAVPLLNRAHQAWRSWQYNRPALANILSQIDRAAGHREAAAPDLPAIRFERSIELARIGLTYDNRAKPALHEFSMTIEKGQFIAVSGQSGAGKSTLADILSGLLLPDRGEMSVDGVALNGSSRSSWRKQVGYLEQNPFFLSASVKDNLAWGQPEIGEQEIKAALARASAGFVLEWPDGLQTQMGESGRQMSGGERRRIALARALLPNPDLLILDEFTASLDAEYRAAVIAAIEQLKRHHTIVAITHDQHVIARADHHVDMDKA